MTESVCEECLTDDPDDLQHRATCLGERAAGLELLRREEQWDRFGVNGYEL